MKKSDYKIELENRFKDYDFSKQDFEVILNFFLQNGNINNLIANDKKYIEEIYLKKIIKMNKENLQNDLENKNFNAVTKLVSAISFSNPQSIIEEYPFEKDLRIFKNIKDIYILSTEDKGIQDKYDEIVKKFKNKYNIQKIKVKNKIIEPIKFISENNINETNTIIDITLGMKIHSISLYKLACETGIPVINWVEPFRKRIASFDDESVNFEERTQRSPLETKVKIMIEPKKESIKNKKRFNEALKKWDFKEVAEYYEMTGNKINSIFFKGFSEVINYDTMTNVDYENYQDKALTFINESIKNYNLNNNIFKNLIKMIYYSLDEINLKKITSQNREFLLGLNESQMLGYKENNSEIDLTEGINIYFYLILNFVNNNYKKISSYLLDYLQRIIYENISPEKPERTLSNNEYKIKEREILDMLADDFNEVNNIEDLKDIINNNTDKAIQLELIDNFINEFTQKIDINKIKFIDSNLIITKFQITTDLNDIKELNKFFGQNKKYRKHAKLLNKLINQTNNQYIVNVSNIEEEKEFFESESRLAADRAEFKKNCKFINEKINTILQEKGIENNPRFINFKNKKIYIDKYYFEYNI